MNGCKFIVCCANEFGTGWEHKETFNTFKEAQEYQEKMFKEYEIVTIQKI